MDRAYRNLLPEYRSAMNDEVIQSLDDIVKYAYTERCIYGPAEQDERVSVSTAEVMGMQQVPAKTNAARNVRNATYAEATRGNGRGGGNAYASETAQPVRQPEGAAYRENKPAYVPRMQSNQDAQSRQQSRPEYRGNAGSAKRNESGSKRPFVGP